MTSKCYGGEGYAAYDTDVSPYLPTQTPIFKIQGTLNKFQRFAASSNLIGTGSGQAIDERYNFKKKFNNLPIPYFDTHCHPDFIINQAEFKGTFKEYMETQTSTIPNSYKGCLAIFCNPKDFNRKPDGIWAQTIKMDNVYTAVGCHPKRVKCFQYNSLDVMSKMLEHPKCVAVGEIGLDYSKDFGLDSERQKIVLKEHVELAKIKNKPIIIHARDSDDEIITELQKHNLSHHVIHRHCFTSDKLAMRKWLLAFPNSFIGLTPLITYNDKKAAAVKECGIDVPLDKLLLETDAPYFIPKEFSNADFKVSHPAMSITVADEISRLRGIDINYILSHCKNNTKTMYGINY